MEPLHLVIANLRGPRSRASVAEALGVTRGAVFAWEQPPGSGFSRRIPPPMLGALLEHVEATPEQREAALAALIAPDERVEAAS